MMNISDKFFSISNFIKLLEYKNRKGIFLYKKFLPESVLSLKEEIKNTKNNLRNITDISKQEEQREEIERLKKKEKEAIKLFFSKLKQEDIMLQKVLYKINKKEREIYSINNKNVWTFFLTNELQYSVKKIYKVKQNNRHFIISCIKSLLNNRSQKYILRTDIKDFYNTINSQELIQKIHQDGILNVQSRKYITSILNQYYNLKGSQNGVPAGIGISAYLSEMYMRDFDKKIKDHLDVLFYARYVDDIIVIFNKPKSTLIEKVREILENDLGLELHDDSQKTTYLENSGSFDYLGYNFNLQDSNFEISLSKNRLNKYKKKIIASFEDYKNYGDKIILIKRLKFLTSNTSLDGNKRNIFVGIYFSNRLLDSSQCLIALDKFLKYNIDKINDTQFKKELTKIFIGRTDNSKEHVRSFVNGFDKKNFIKWKLNDLKEIVKIWYIYDTKTQTN